MAINQSQKMAPEVIALIQKHGVYSAGSTESCREAPAIIRSGHDILDKFFGGGLAAGCLSEWGMTAGQGAHEVVLRFVISVTRAGGQVLWVNGQEELGVYPTAWSARGVDLQMIHFVDTQKPLDDLKPVFLEPCFDLVVLDAPGRISGDDWAFLARQARLLQMHVMVVQNFFLSSRRGNVWARTRVNCEAALNNGDRMADSPFAGWRLKALRGAVQQVIELGALDL